MLAALFLVSILASSSLAGYFPRTPRFYNWLNQQGEVIQYLPGVVGDEKYPQQYPEMGGDFGPDTNQFIEFVQDYDPLEHYPYVNDPYEGFGPSSNEEDHSNHQDPLDQYPYVNNPYDG